MRQVCDPRTAAKHAKSHSIEAGAIFRYLDDRGQMRCARIANVFIEQGIVLFESHIQVGTRLTEEIDILRMTRDRFLRIVPRPN